MFKRIFFLSGLLACVFSCSVLAQPADPAACFTGNFKDRKIYLSKTGLTNLRVDSELEVSSPGKYKVYAFLSGSAVKDDFIAKANAIVDLGKGTHEVSLTFDGRTLVRGKFDKYTMSIFIIRLLGEGKYFEIDEKKEIELSTYDYKDFAQKPVVIQDRTQNPEDVVCDLVSKFGYKVIKERKVEKVLLQKLFGEEVDTSFFDLYSCIVRNAGFGISKAYVAIAKDMSQAFVIDNGEMFNLLVGRLGLSLDEEADAVFMAKLYLHMMYCSRPEPQVVERFPEDDTTLGSDGRTFMEWFSENEEYDFYPPYAEKVEGGFKVFFYSWVHNGGVLLHHTFLIEDNGVIPDYWSKVLADHIGKYILI